MQYHMAEQCPDCMGYGKAECCDACSHEGCRQCLTMVPGPDGFMWRVCDMCADGIKLLAEEALEARKGGQTWDF